MDPSIQSQILCVHTLGKILGLKLQQTLLSSGRKHWNHTVVHLQNMHVPTSLQIFQVIREFDTVQDAIKFHNDPGVITFQAQQTPDCQLVPKEMIPAPFQVGEDTKVYSVTGHPISTPISKIKQKMDMILVLWRKGKFVHKVYMSGVTGVAKVSMQKMKRICNAVHKL